MIFLYHIKGQRVLKVVNNDGISIDIPISNPTEALLELGLRYPEQWIVWCEQDLESRLAISAIIKALHHKAIMISDLSISNPVPKAIDYIEESPFLKVNLEVMYPTWKMSGSAGAIHGSVLKQLKGQVDFKINFDSALNIISKSCQAQGVFCYHVPLFTGPPERTDRIKTFDPYSFAALTYKKRWLPFLFLCQILFEKRFPLFSFLKGILISKHPIICDIDANLIKSTRSFPEDTSVDVIIPTMGRATYLYDVLKDFSAQTILPTKIIIVEQNSDTAASSELDYLATERWPFEIIHEFIYKTGACNARNIALAKTSADWVFFADDDNRFEPTVIEQALRLLEKYGQQALTTSYLQEGEHKTFTTPKQWTTFGSGNSFVKGTLSRKLQFNTSYEHGYGEDTDYGMQLRNAGADILYHPDIDLVHLKAPIGGFRNKFEHPWANDDPAPKPSPTVMLYRLKHTTQKQLQGYKLRLFLRQLKRVPLVQKLNYISTFRQQWNTSVKWANYLKKQ